MTCSIDFNGTITSWKTKDGLPILFPETMVKSRGKLKQRGGAPVCCPNFGTAPTDGPYQGIELPQHGLVRLCEREDGQPTPDNTAVDQSGPTFGQGGWVSSHFVFEEPWKHEVWVSSKTSRPTPDRTHRLSHRVSLLGCSGMPYSIGFHPYFATGGDTFFLRYGKRNWGGLTLIVDEPFFVPREPHVPFIIETAHGTLELEPTAGYNGFFVWTDRPDLYICVEPVCVDIERRYRILECGQWVDCTCNITYTPK